MAISTEGKIGIGLALVAIAGAGAMQIAPEYHLIGWISVVIGVGGLLILAAYHFWAWIFALYQGKRKYWSVPLSVVVFGLTVWQLSGPIERFFNFVPPHKPTMLTLFMNTARRNQTTSFLGYVDVSSPLLQQQVRLFSLLLTDRQSAVNYLAIYVPPSNHAYELIDALAQGYPNLLQADVGERLKEDAGSDVTDSAALPFSGRIIVYYENVLSDEQTGELTKTFRKAGARIELHGPQYADASFESIKAGTLPQPVDYELRNNLPAEIGGPDPTPVEFGKPLEFKAGISTFSLPHRPDQTFTVTTKVHN